MKTPKQKDSAMKIVKALVSASHFNKNWETTPGQAWYGIFSKDADKIIQRAKRFLKDKK